MKSSSRPIDDMQRVPAPIAPWLTWLRRFPAFARHYGAAILLSLLAVALTAMVPPLRARAPFLLSLAAVMLSSWIGGLGAGVFTTLLTFLLLVYFILPPDQSFTLNFPDDITLIAGYLLITLGMSWLNATRKRAVESLGTLAAVARTANEGVWLVDLEGRTTYANSRMAVMLGTTPEQMAGRTVLEYTFPEDAQAGRDRILSNLSGHAEQFDFRFRREDGQKVLTLACTSPMRNEAGVIVGALGMFTDVTERRQIETALRRSEERFRAVQELSLDAFTILESVRDEQRRIVDFEWVYVNPTAAEILRHPAHELVGQRLLDVLPGNGTNGLFDNYVRVVETGQPHDMELPYSGEGIRGWFRNMTVKLGDGVAVSFADITERKEVETRQRFLADASKILSASLDYKTTLANIAHLTVPQMADYCTVQVVESDGWLVPVEAAHVDPDKLDILWRVLRQYPVDPASNTPSALAIRTKMAQYGSQVTEEELVTRITYNDEMLALNRLLNPQSYIVIPLIVRDQVVGTMTCVYTDSGRRYDRADLATIEELAQRCAIAIDNARLYSQAQEAIRLRDEFLSIASHELKTPLTSLLLQTQLLLRYAQDETGRFPPDRLRSTLVSNEEQIKRLVGLINALLDVSRLDAARFELNPDKADLTAIAQQVVSLFRSEAAAAGSAVELCAPGPAEGWWDAARLDQVVTNLLTNAIKYGNGKPITVKVEADERIARLVVQDQGIGIPPERLPHVFDRFERAVRDERYSGVGLGLYIVQQIVEAHGGAIHVESVVGQGSTFRVELPRYTLVSD